MRPMLADLDTLSAEYANLRAEGNLALASLRLGVVTPKAAERTAFQKDRRPNPGAVMQGNKVGTDITGRRQAELAPLNMVQRMIVFAVLYLLAPMFLIIPMMIASFTPSTANASATSARHQPFMPRIR